MVTPAAASRGRSPCTGSSNSAFGAVWPERFPRQGPAWVFGRQEAEIREKTGATSFVRNNFVSDLPVGQQNWRRVEAKP